MTSVLGLNPADLTLSQQVEDLLIEKNLRGMKSLQPLLTPGYIARAAELLQLADGVIFIGTGFPVGNTFETDGPVGAIALYQALAALNKRPVLVCGDPLYSAVKNDYEAIQLPLGHSVLSQQQVTDIIAQWQPQAVISIERAGRTADGKFYNMRGEDISARCACFDDFMTLSNCPSIGIGDGGNEIGMGNIHQQLAHLNIVPSVTTCSELVIADVSNWAAYGLILFLQKWNQTNLLSLLNPLQIIQYLSLKGSVDGVTRDNTLTEDGLCYSEGLTLLDTLKQLTA
ncbi:glutamate cyclase domain-containing protein [Neptunicella marina]|uniref:DUF4392 domain-containing protein n=1 Tax=Neptunicella marina TaxID=2125989 RepID=A0A8J6M368_9ALTE|nr:glutamate cyclase domain-containing protein [Neptunicella marina]MBC3765126.1 DUF4392 domain-containing protein [Neptunicella marina]